MNAFKYPRPVPVCYNLSAAMRRIQNWGTTLL
jgi:hypothetical protein